MTYKSPTKAMSHQLAAIEASLNKPPVPCNEDAFAFLMDMGTGKSKVVLDEWGDLATNGGPRDLIVIAPKSCIRNWYADKGRDPSQWSEMRKHVDPEFMKKLVHASWVGGGRAWERDMRRMMAASKDKKRPRAFFVNVEALSGKNEEALRACLDFAEQRGAHVVVDESTTIKGNSARTEAAIQIGEVAHSKRILSGLWTPKSPMDLYYQCRFLSPDILGQKNFFTFRRRYATMIMQTNYSTGRKFPQITGYQNLEELQQRVGRYSYRVLKKDCLDLPSKIYSSRDVDLTADQRRMLKEIRLFGHTEIGAAGSGKFVTTDMVIKRIMREIQITCGYVMDDEERVLHEVPENKTKTMMEVLSEHRGKAIVWCPWRAPLDKIVRTIAAEYGPRSVAQFHGGNVRARAEEEYRFLNDPECLYMAATQGAGMRGNTWTVADLVIYYANDWDLEKRDQSEDRAHRIGQKNHVTYVDLIAQGTVESKMVTALRRKIDLATMINREGHREWLI
jgi:hypothetical protein